MVVTCEKCKCKFKSKDALEFKFCGKCGNPLIEVSEDGAIEKGYILDRRYEIIEVVKEGGMGCVYKAKDIRLGNECAVKEMMNTEEKEDQKYSVKRFEEEALILSKLRHVGLPVVSDYFIENGRYYLVMDYIKGKDLETILLDELEGKPMNEDDIIHYSVQTLDVIEYLHSQEPQIIYRDLKPGNIMIRDYDKRVVLVDFGIARTIRTDSSTTKTSIGTFGYCAIEQVKGKPEPRSDIYSMGATMHHMITGVQPQFLTIEPVEKLNPSASKKLQRIINKATQEEAENRFSSAKEMMEELMAPEVSLKLLAEEYPDMIYIPAGEFWMGNNKGDPNEYPIHKIFVQAFLIDRYPVTNEQFDKFVRETGSKATNWRRTFKAGMEKFPVVNINWAEASEYAEWAGKRLPGEAEWEKAARGTDARKLPWGNVWGDHSVTGHSSVGSFPDRVSPYGVMDMVGNIYEWTKDWYFPYPYKGPYENGKTKVVRGGRSQFSTCSYRGFEIPDYRSSSRGFRCVVDF